MSNYQVKRCVKLSGEEVCQTIRFRGGSNYQVQSWVKLSNSEMGQTIRFRGGSNYKVQRWVILSGAEMSQSIRCRGGSNYPFQRCVKPSGEDVGQTDRCRAQSVDKRSSLAVAFTGIAARYRGQLSNLPDVEARQTTRKRSSLAIAFWIENTATWRVREKTDTCNGGLSDDEKQQIDSRVVKC